MREAYRHTSPNGAREALFKNETHAQLETLCMSLFFNNTKFIRREIDEARVCPLR